MGWRGTFQSHSGLDWLLQIANVFKSSKGFGRSHLFIWMKVIRVILSSCSIDVIFDSQLYMCIRFEHKLTGDDKCVFFLPWVSVNMNYPETNGLSEVEHVPIQKGAIILKISHSFFAAFAGFLEADICIHSTFHWSHNNEVVYFQYFILVPQVTLP